MLVFVKSRYDEGSYFLAYLGKSAKTQAVSSTSQAYLYGEEEILSPANNFFSHGQDILSPDLQLNNLEVISFVAEYPVVILSK